MTLGGKAHIMMIIASCLIGTLLFIKVRNSDKKTQNMIIYSAMGICIFGIFYLHGTRYFTTLDINNLLVQMLQVCNFNLILLPLCLFKKHELARQYLFFFSMPMALSTFVSYPSDIANSMWYSKVCLTFWINHYLIALIPLLMLAARKFKPRIEYIPKVVMCIFIYFLVSFIGNYILNGFAIEGAHNHSYTMRADGILLLKPIYELIPIPFIYLLPIAPLLLLLYLLVARLLKNYPNDDSFGVEKVKEKGRLL